jgi:two-component system, sensor histidine kinase and response regulator
MDLDCAVLDGAGFDSAAGLKIVGGKADRYAKILHKFADRESSTVNDIRAALDAGDSATAERAAHSLKGSASTLGANGLADAAAEVETAIRCGHGVEEALETLSDSLRNVLSAIQHALAG